MRILWLALGAATIVALSVFAAWNTQSVDVYFQGIGTLRGVPLWLVVIAGAAIGAIATLLLEMPGRVRGVLARRRLSHQMLEQARTLDSLRARVSELERDLSGARAALAAPPAAARLDVPDGTQAQVSPEVN